MFAVTRHSNHPGNSFLGKEYDHGRRSKSSPGSTNEALNKVLSPITRRTIRRRIAVTGMAAPTLADSRVTTGPAAADNGTTASGWRTAKVITVVIVRTLPTVPGCVVVAGGVVSDVGVSVEVLSVAGGYRVVR